MLSERCSVCSRIGVWGGNVCDGEAGRCGVAGVEGDPGGELDGRGEELAAVSSGSVSLSFEICRAIKCCFQRLLTAFMALLLSFILKLYINHFTGVSRGLRSGCGGRVELEDGIEQRQLYES